LRKKLIKRKRIIVPNKNIFPIDGKDTEEMEENRIKNFKVGFF
jgi:hypothetical protein